MPDRYGRLGGKERRSAALLGLTYFAGRTYSSGLRDYGLGIKVRAAVNVGCTDADIAQVLGWCERDVKEFRENNS